MKFSRNECRSVYCIFVGKKINANQIYSKMHPVYGDKCFTKQIVHVFCKKMLKGQTFCIIYRGAISRSSVAWTTANRRFFASGIRKFADR